MSNVYLLRALAAAVPPDATAIASRTKGFAALRGLEFISADVIPLVGRTT